MNGIKDGTRCSNTVKYGISSIASSYSHKPDRAKLLSKLISKERKGFLQTPRLAAESPSTHLLSGSCRRSPASGGGGTQQGYPLQ
jgi:hypothetical protein